MVQAPLGKDGGDEATYESREGVMGKRAQRPQGPEVQVANVPEELRALPRWVGWRYERRDDKWTKVPISCLTDERGDITKPATWATFEEALGYSRSDGIDGIGFVI